MVIEFIELIFQICSISLVIIAAGLWASAGVTSRPKHRDEQTMVGGAIWSQIIIPIGLLICKVVEESIDQFVEGYYLVIGILLLWTTGVLLIVYETRRYKRRLRREELRAMRTAITLATRPQSSRTGILGLFLGSPSSENIKYPYDKAYLAIGVLCILAGVVKVVEFVIIGLVIVAAGLWAGAGVSTKPKHRDKQTIIGGTLWSQIIIPIGLMLAKVVEEEIFEFVEGYYLVTGILLLWINGVLLIIYEVKRYRRKHRREEMRQAMREAITHETSRESIRHSRNHTSRLGLLGLLGGSPSHERLLQTYDKAYFAIGFLCILSGILKLVELIVFVILDAKLFTNKHIVPHLQPSSNSSINYVTERD
ncbi:hypothetical protein PYW08_002077 [Mythimna loreyi]|uniref:Uncharacterized protein n=1 Tax=Mythimna loreyi TaxID=667449 RepID=A0ACC2R190_9NEOP|nr:hypothetical protein PYW08_002077 [Mythimna loreyi]